MYLMWSGRKREIKDVSKVLALSSRANSCVLPEKVNSGPRAKSFEGTVDNGNKRDRTKSQEERVE